jgi:hypothetical protein
MVETNRQTNKSCIHGLEQNIAFMPLAMQRIELVPLYLRPRYSGSHKLFPRTVRIHFLKLY